MSKPDISVVLPCYNEKENILLLIEAISKELHGKKYEIIVVDDNSPDGTFDLVSNSGIENTIAYKRTKDPSLALSIRHGIEKAQGEAIIVMDSDFNHKPEYLNILIDNLKYYDCVLASRFVYGGDMGNRFRHLSSWIFNLFNRIVTRTFITDSLFGFFAVNRSALEKIDYDAVFWGYGDYCIRLMYYMQKNDATILQIPSVLGQRVGGEGNSQLLKTLIQYTSEVAKLVLVSIKSRRKNDL